MKRRKPKGQGSSPAKRKPTTVQPLNAERLLCGFIPEIHGDRVVAASQGSGRFAAQLAVEHPESRVTCHFLDLYHARRATDIHGPHVPNLEIVCSADLPDGPFDVAAFPMPSGGEAELTRDRMQQAHARLDDGGRLIVASDNPKDVWLHEQMQNMFPKVTRFPQEQGVIYSGRKTQPLKKIKDFRCEFAFRDDERLIHVATLPGVFSHRRLDGGARALMNAMQIRPGDRVCDMGCGCGAVGLAASFRVADVAVTAIDSNPRAIECTQWAVEKNGVQRFDLLLDASGLNLEPATYDVFLGNPPYFSHYRIAEIFVRAAGRALKPGGRVYLVSRQAGWFINRLAEEFRDVQSDQTRNGYFVISAVK